MKVLFSTVTYSEVKEKREKAFENSNFLTRKDAIAGLSLKEKAVHILIKRLPFLLLYVTYLGYVLNKYSGTFYTKVHNFIKRISISDDISVFSIVLICVSVTCVVIGIYLILAYKALFFMVRKLLPRKTPITAREYQYECFWNETREIEKAFEVMNSIARRSAEDIAYSEMIVEKGSNTITLLLKDSRFGIITKDAYCISNEAMMKKIEETGELDFTFIDKEWNELLVKYQIK